LADIVLARCAWYDGAALWANCSHSDTSNQFNILGLGKISGARDGEDIVEL